MIMNIFLSISTFVHASLYSSYAVLLCLIAYAALLIWLYNIVFESFSEPTPWSQGVYKKITRFLMLDLSSQNKAIDNIMLEQNNGNEF